jgi:UDP-N-acetylmuramoyl-tripeptide--D-alanyl-D-alanine ligase
LGANHQGENHFLCTLCLPDYGLITNIGKDHLEGFGGLDGVEKANAELFDNLREHGGSAFVNLDDPHVASHAQGLDSIFYGTSEKADIKGNILEKFPFLKAHIHGNCRDMHIQSHLFGSFNLYNILAAAAVGISFNVSEDDITAAIESYVPANNRSQLVIRGTNTIILDAYNANPSSMQGGVADFSLYPAQSRVLLLGDMFELGSDSRSEHEALLRAIHPEDFSLVALAGSEFYFFKDKFPFAFFETTAALLDFLKSRTFTGSTFYIKGSRGMKMESVLNAIPD